MANFETVTLTGTGPTNSVKVDLSRFNNGCGLICSVTVGAAALYSVQVSGDNTNWNDHDIIFNKTTSQNGNISYPVGFVRLNGATTDGSVVLVIVQAS